MTLLVILAALPLTLALQHKVISAASYGNTRCKSVSCSASRLARRDEEQRTRFCLSWTKSGPPDRSRAVINALNRGGEVENFLRPPPIPATAKKMTSNLLSFFADHRENGVAEPLAQEKVNISITLLQRNVSFPEAFSATVSKQRLA